MFGALIEVQNENGKWNFYAFNHQSAVSIRSIFWQSQCHMIFTFNIIYVISNSNERSNIRIIINNNNNWLVFDGRWSGQEKIKWISDFVSLSFFPYMFHYMYMICGCFVVIVIQTIYVQEWEWIGFHLNVLHKITSRTFFTPIHKVVHTMLMCLTFSCVNKNSRHKQRLNRRCFEHIQSL